jgi:phenylalanyl-tRNA synthetase beta chain
VRLFEVGRTFHRDAEVSPVNGFHQPWKLAGLAFGGALPEGWGSDSRKVDFYDVKGDVEALLAPAQLRFEKLIHPALHPGRAARMLLDGKEIGCLGELHPEWVQKYDLPQAPGGLFELDFAAVKAARCRPCRGFKISAGYSRPGHRCRSKRGFADPCWTA